jgi:putative FmdB family regulatory protein
MLQIIRIQAVYSFMPMLDFKCNKCGSKFEELVFAHNKDRVRCPKCGENDLSRVYEGKCLFGSFSGGGRKDCCASGNCSTCSGCSH